MTKLKNLQCISLKICKFQKHLEISLFEKVNFYELKIKYCWVIKKKFSI